MPHRGVHQPRAHARVARGELEQAGRALAGDSSVEATALRGWVALYQGDIGNAAELFRSAGPYAGRPGEATDRTQMLALLQRLGPVQSRELGSALLLLGRGDSAGALAALGRHDRQEARHGRAPLRCPDAAVGPDHLAPVQGSAQVVGSEVGQPVPQAEERRARLLGLHGEQAFRGVGHGCVRPLQQKLPGQGGPVQCPATQDVGHDAPRIR